jgi:hypothetical protein
MKRGRRPDSHWQSGVAITYEDNAQKYPSIFHPWFNQPNNIRHSHKILK